MHLGRFIEDSIPAGNIACIGKKHAQWTQAPSASKSSGAHSKIFSTAGVHCGHFLICCHSLAEEHFGIRCKATLAIHTVYGPVPSQPEVNAVRALVQIQLAAPPCNLCRERTIAGHLAAKVPDAAARPQTGRLFYALVAQNGRAMDF